jgi:methylamine utilization protein MauE
MTEWGSRAFVVIRVVLGLLLLAAAGLKIYGWSVSTVPPVGWFSAPGVQAAAIGWEILLGAWLLCGVAPFGSWLASIGTFTLLAGISGYLGWIGQATCGCFGTIKASPWHAFAVDAAALAFLAVCRPKQEASKTVQEGGWLRVVSPTANFVFGVAVIIACLTCIGSWVYGSPEAALARLRGESVVVKPEYVDCGTGKPGDTLEAAIDIHNWSDHPLRIYGATSDCSCLATKGLPITIPPGGQ